MEAIVAESQFIAYGERHGSFQTSKLMSALMPLLAEHGFTALALEVGPHSADKLDELSTPPETTTTRLAAFNAEYALTEIGGEPIPFFDGLEDAQFLAAASRAGLELWGLDQEFVFSPVFLMDEMAATLAPGAVDPGPLRSSREKAQAVARRWLIEDDRADDDIGVYGALLRDPDITAYFSLVSKASPRAAEIADALRLSWGIYARWREDSHYDRVSYMRNNFMAHYEAAAQSQEHPKVFLKFGQVHMAQIPTKGAFDLGYLTEELARRNGTRTTNINTWTRYHEEDGKEIDNLPRFYRRVSLFAELGVRDRWTLIDLTSIREDLDAGRIALPTNGDYHELNWYLRAYDYQLILPLDRTVTPNGVTAAR